MDRSSRRRVCKAEETLSIAKLTAQKQLIHSAPARVRRRTLELLIDDGDLNYRTAKRQAVRDMGAPKSVEPKATFNQENWSGDPKEQMLCMLERVANCLASSLGEAPAGWTAKGVDQAESCSLAERFALQALPRRIEIIQAMANEEVEYLLYDWNFWARPKQLLLPGDWSTCVLRAGRGFGKTRTGAGWVHERAMTYPNRRIALVARTLADARDYMIEGPGGFLRNTHPKERPQYEPSKRRLTWPNGSWATIYTDEEPEQLRGFSGDTAWLDEFAKYQHP